MTTTKYARWERKLCGCVRCVADEKSFQMSVYILLGVAVVLALFASVSVALIWPML